VTRLLFTTTHGPEDPERATVPFIAAATAVASGVPAVVVCTAEAVRLGLPGVAEEVEEDGMPPLVDLLQQVVAGDGEVWLCSACTTKRGITGDQVREGTTIVGAATIVGALTEPGTSAVSLT
jgi:uncharacterized protein